MYGKNVDFHRPLPPENVWFALMKMLIFMKGPCNHGNSKRIFNILKIYGDCTRDVGSLLAFCPPVPPKKNTISY